MIIGLTGGIGHGKTTFGAYLGACAPSYAAYESSDLIIEVANAWRANRSAFPDPTDIADINTWLAELPDVLAMCVHRKVELSALELTPERLNEHADYYRKLFDHLEDMGRHRKLAQTTIAPHNKSDFRPLLQWLGGYLAKMVSGDIWYAEIVRRINQAEPVDLVVVGGVRFPADAQCLRTAGGLILSVVRPEIAEKDQHDLTERERGLITPDITIFNDGSLDDLKIMARKVYADMERGESHRAYRAADKHKQL